MTKKEVYKIWSPSNLKWSNWVRPVPFVDLDKNNKILEIVDYNFPSIYYIDKYLKDMAIIIDINGVDSIKEGISLSRIGYQPIPIFNGTNPSLNVKSNVDNLAIGPYLIWGATELSKINLGEYANPVFLLDNNRLNRYRINRNIFDNSWDVYPQDLPSSKYFLNNGITKILVRGNEISKDLKKILYRYQLDNMKIYFTNGYDIPREIKIGKVKIENS